MIKGHDPHVRGIVVLGLDAPEAELMACFEEAARHDLVKGFAVGRTIYSEAARAWLAGTIDDMGAVVVIAVAAGLGVLLAARLGGRYSVAAALAWGLVWIGVGRLTSGPLSTPVAIAAFVAALVVIAAAIRFHRPADPDSTLADGRSPALP